MSFHDTFQNPHLVNEYLVADCEKLDGSTVPSSLNLNDVLGNTNGEFKWGGKAFSTSAQSISLSGSMLSVKLKRGAEYVKVRVDLSAHIRNNDGILEAFNVPAASLVDPPPYSTTGSTFKAYRAYRSTKLSSESRSASFFMYTVESDKLHLERSILHAQCRKMDGTSGYASSKLDLNDYIGIVNGKLVWGRSGFYAICEKVRLEGYKLVVECRDRKGDLVTSRLDLTRYLQTYDGGLGVNVAESNHEISTLFSEAPWIKFKVVTEPDASVDIGVPFKSAFQEIAHATSKHVTAIMTEEITESVTQEVMASMTDQAKASVTQQVADSMNAKIEEAFATAKKAVLYACDEMISAAVKNVTIKCEEVITGPVKEVVAARCNEAITQAVIDVTASAIEHFQQRAEILIEQEAASVHIRAAQSALSYLNLFGAVDNP